VLEKLVTDFAVFRQKPNMDDFRRWMKQLEAHNIVVRLEGKYSEPECRFTILPTILTAVSSEKMNVLVQNLRREDDGDEETEEGPAD
jgi:glutaredoxin-related protein